MELCPFSQPCHQMCPAYRGQLALQYPGETVTYCFF